MPSFPMLMVLYVNDAAEVRYCDGSKLQLAPCGSAFQHESPAPETSHPVLGKVSVQQRTRFVTSDYRHKVLEALDFRNRFAQRPYVCTDLCHKDEVVPLHSDITEVAWPKSLKEASVEVFQDGSVKLTSKDELASLVLSAHGRDFTVCYLSKISTAPVKSPPSGSCATSSEPSQPVHSSPSDIRNRHVSGGSSSEKSTNSNNSSRNSRKSKVNKNPSGNSHCSSNAVKSSASSAFVAYPTAQTIHAVYRHRRQGSHGSNPKFSDGESSTHSAQSFDSNSVASSLEDELISSYIDLNINGNACIHAQPKPESSMQTNVLRSTSKSRRANRNHRHSKTHPDSQSKGLALETSPNISPISHDAANQVTAGFVTEDAMLGDHQSKCRQYYNWVTQHVSCSDCPPHWSHAVTLVKERWETLQKDSSTPQIGDQNTPNPAKSSDGTEQNIQSNKLLMPKLDKDQYCMCSLPAPVNLTCPRQHLHRWSSPLDTLSRDPLDGHSLTGCASGGRIKVIMSEGIIYRMSRLPSVPQVEIYPGDGTVLCTQGMTGHFFTHIIPKPDSLQVEEKTYSVKVPPHEFPGSPYSIAKLIKSGARYFSNIAQEENNLSSVSFGDLFCWKYQQVDIPSSLHDPSPTVLDEHNVPGLGKFLAYTNGRIRIVFADRTALDMRTALPGHKSGNNNEISSVLDSIKSKMWGDAIPQGYCRLLLPNGKYVIVELANPGSFQQYVDFALEWASWSTSSSKDRETFYRGSSPAENGTDISPESELRKINCFNYVVENTVFKDQALSPNSSQDFSGGFSHLPGDHGDGDRFRPAFSMEGQANHTTRPNVYQGDIQSFDDVRLALQKTSQIIHDIDSLLSTRK